MNNGLFRAFDPDTGKPLSLGKVYTYEPGTTTPRTAYQDKAKVASHLNPIILNTTGEAVIFLEGEYDLAVYDSDDVLVFTMSDVYGAMDEGSIQTIVDDSVAASIVGYDVRLIQATETLVIEDAARLLRVDASLGDVTLTLPTAAAMGDDKPAIWIKRIDNSANTVTIDGNGSETIDGALTYSLASQHQSAALRCNGSVWNLQTESVPSSQKVISKAANYTILSADRSKLHIGTAALTFTLPPSQDGLVYQIKASGGAVAIDPDGSETINGNSIFTLQDGETAHLTGDGTGWHMDVPNAYRPRVHSQVYPITPALDDTHGSSPVADQHKTNGVNTEIILASGESVDFIIDHQVQLENDTVTSSIAQVSSSIHIEKGGVPNIGPAARVYMDMAMPTDNNKSGLSMLAGTDQVTLTGPGTFTFFHELKTLTFGVGELCDRDSQRFSITRASDV